MHGNMHVHKHLDMLIFSWTHAYSFPQMVWYPVLNNFGFDMAKLNHCFIFAILSFCNPQFKVYHILIKDLLKVLVKSDRKLDRGRQTRQLAKFLGTLYYGFKEIGETVKLRFDLCEKRGKRNIFKKHIMT